MKLFKAHSSPEAPARPRAAAPRLLSFRSASLQAQGRREYQEDRLLQINTSDVTLIRKQGLLAAVADGMGGMKGGAEASSAVADELQMHFAQFDRSSPLGPQLSQAARAAGQRVCGILGGAGGSTLVACTIYNEFMDWVSVGDSYIFILRNGGLFRLNQEQTIRSELMLDTIHAGSLSCEAAELDPEKDCLISFLGMQDQKEPEFSRSPLKLLDGDRILICSDGVPNALSGAELAGIMTIPNPSQACEAICSKIEEKAFPHQDNYTAVLIYCSY